MTSVRHFRTKMIRFKKRNCRIILQNENGPCPLLAIFNSLILRGDKFINQYHEHKAQIVSSKDLSVILANRLMSVKKEDMNTTERNLQQNINDSICVLPNLINGMDINVRFDNIFCFEFSSELGIFDILRIPLVHGWVVDPEDSELTGVCGRISYNQAVEKQIMMEEYLVSLQKENEEKKKMKKSINKVKNINNPKKKDDNEVIKKTVLFKKIEIEEKKIPIRSPNDDEKEYKEKEEWVIVDKENEEKLGVESSDDEFPVEMEVDGEEEEGGGGGGGGGAIPLGSLRFEIEIPNLEEDIFEEQQQQLTNNNNNNNGLIHSLPFPANHIDHSNQPLEKEIIKLDLEIQKKRLEEERKKRRQEKIIREGMIIKKFLISTSDQMTYFGIEQLHLRLKKGRLYVLFRNHHFSTILKHSDGYIYMLCNDVGYANKPDVVWERLTDQEIFDGDFRVYVEKEIIIQPAPPQKKIIPEKIKKNTSSDNNNNKKIENQKRKKKEDDDDDVEIEYLDNDPNSNISINRPKKKKKNKKKKNINNNSSLTTNNV